jgi:formylglycine-generating enzyme
MNCFGMQSRPSLRTTCNPAAQALAAEPVLPAADDALRAMRPGDWAPGRSVPCARAGSPDMVCLPGGAFLLGDARIVAVADQLRTSPERLVVLSPFELDRDEVTVGGVRALFAAGALGDEGLFVRTDESPCTFVERGKAEDDALPVTCVTHAFASNACRAMGKRLPTEAEWEYAAGSTTRELAYPWGDVADACARAIVGRARTPLEKNQAIDSSTACRAAAAGPLLPWGVVAGGAPATDVTTEGVRNMGGNVREWVRDVFQSYTEPCWVPAGSRLQDPSCITDGTLRSVRGASWADVPQAGASASRYAFSVTQADASVGFRCARSF